MKKILISLLPCYVVQNNSFIGPYICKVTAVNVNYGVYSLILDTDQKISLTGAKVYFTKFFAAREVKRLEKQLALKLAEDDALRNIKEDNAMELKL